MYGPVRNDSRAASPTWQAAKRCVCGENADVAQCPFELYTDRPHHEGDDAAAVAMYFTGSNARLCTQCSAQTVSKRVKDAGDSFRHHLPQDQLLRVIDDTCHLESTGRADGYRIIQSALFGKANVRATAADVRHVLQAHDPQASEARRERILPRRTYDVTDGMILWHMDSMCFGFLLHYKVCSAGLFMVQHFVCAGYEKLKMYGFLVHACIDGGSNFCVYATLALEKSGGTLCDAFDKAVGAYGYPLRMRADMAFEATFVWQTMLDERGEGSFITGPSTANQVQTGCMATCID